jgi:hypothetical protein
VLRIPWGVCEADLVCQPQKTSIVREQQSDGSSVEVHDIFGMRPIGFATLQAQLVRADRVEKSLDVAAAS